MLFYKTYLQPLSTEWVVFVHGAGSNSSIWFQQLKEFVKHFNVLMIDLRGHGRSRDFLRQHPGYDPKYSFRDVSQDVVEVMNFLKLPPAHFVGISLGSIIIRMVGEVDPAKIKTTILGGAITRLNNFSRFMVHFANFFRRLVPFFWLYALCAYILMPGRRHRPSRLLFIREARKMDQDEFIRWFKLTGEVNPLLRYFFKNEMPVPTLYIMGQDDFMFLPHVKKVAAAHQHASLEILDDCGHICNVEQAELFNRLAVEFIKKHS